MPTRVDLDEVTELRRERNAQLVEVLSRDAFEKLHLPGAINVPLGDLDEESTRDLDRSRPTIVYCYDSQ